MLTFCIWLIWRNGTMKVHQAQATSCICFSTKQLCPPCVSMLFNISLCFSFHLYHAYIWMSTQFSLSQALSEKLPKEVSASIYEVSNQLKRSERCFLLSWSRLFLRAPHIFAVIRFASGNNTRPEFITTWAQNADFQWLFHRISTLHG